mmetsp:Transcript_34505/g.101401  ORF Transcript_34505/g.101401 Transcript_34505/m.101401 type:complete len:204 (-) Transcript_34505:140-751(-)
MPLTRRELAITTIRCLNRVLALHFVGATAAFSTALLLRSIFWQFNSIFNQHVFKLLVVRLRARIRLRIILGRYHKDAMTNSHEAPKTSEDEYTGKRCRGEALFKVKGKLKNERQCNNDNIQNVKWFSDEILGLQTDEDEAQFDEKNAKDGDCEGKKGNMNVVKPFIFVVIAARRTRSFDASVTDRMLIVVAAPSEVPPVVLTR